MNLEEYVEVPTVVPCTNFEPIEDARALRKAMKGFGTDEKAIIEILTKRSNAQRQVIAQAYKKEFGRGEGDDEKSKQDRDLIEDLKSELGGDLEKVIVGLMLPTYEYCAKQINKAVKGLGTDEEVLVEMICARSQPEIRAIAEAYQRMFGETLEDAVAGDTSGPFRKLLVMTIAGGRDEQTVDPEKAREQAEALYAAGEAQLGTDESTFVQLLGHLGQQQLFLVFEEYKKVSGKTIVQALESEMSGELLSGLLAIVKCVNNRPRYFAEKLYKAMKGLGTDDSTLIRIIVSRCEIDLANIKAEYERDYGVTLLSAVKSETSGDYKRALAAIIGSA